MPNLAPLPSCILPYIPAEISLRIAQDLDLPTGLNLMRTCRALQHCGEMRVYHTLDLTSGSRNKFDTKLDRPSDNEYKTRARIVESKAKLVLAILEKFPRLKSHVRCLRIEPSDDQGIRLPLIDILTLVSETLVSLDIVPLRAPTHWNIWKLEEFGTKIFFRSLRTANLPFSRLLRFHYVFPEEAKPPIDPWMLRMSSLTKLHISSADDKAYPKLEEPLVLAPGSFPHLREITLDHLNDVDGIILLTTLLDLAPNARLLRLRGDWSPTVQSKGLQALGKSKQLKTIVTCDEASLSPESKGMDFPSFGSVELVVEEAAVEYGQWHEWEELALLNAFDIPRTPALQRLTILTTVRPPLADYTSISLGPTPLTTFAIPLEFFVQLRLAPLLSSILFLHLQSPFPSPYDTDFAEPSYFVPSDDGVNKDHRGVVVREFQAPAEIDGASLFHLRILSRSVSHGTEPYVASRRYIQDWTSYKGATVPRYVLTAVYRASGEEMEFMKGGRNLKLGIGDEAWRILEEWRDTVEDEVEGV